MPRVPFPVGLGVDWLTLDPVAILATVMPPDETGRWFSGTPSKPVNRFDPGLDVSIKLRWTEPISNWPKPIKLDGSHSRQFEFRVGAIEDAIAL